MSNTLLIYGAYGYTGELITRHAVQQGIKPIIAGHDAQRLEKLAQELQLDFVVVDLADTKKLEQTLRDVDVVLHVAGPYIKTAKPMLDACT